MKHSKFSFILSSSNVSYWKNKI